jgi:predicted DNA-binding protein (MmcQ/YjbR family)
MSSRLHGVTAFSRFVSSLPGVTLHEQWGSHVAKVGGKVFALIGAEHAAICFKVEELSFDGLTGLADVTQAPYFAKRQWVAVGRAAPLSGAELKAYIERSYELVAVKLTRQARAELGIGPQRTTR